MLEIINNAPQQTASRGRYIKIKYITQLKSPTPQFIFSATCPKTSKSRTAVSSRTKYEKTGISTAFPFNCFQREITMNDEELRLDKWLWCARLFKTRTLASDACKSGKVKINDISMKPSHTIKTDEVIEVHLGQLHKTVQVKSIPKTVSLPSWCRKFTPT